MTPCFSLRALGAAVFTVAVAVSAPAGAEPSKPNPTPYPDFTFKRQKAPEPGSAKRGLIQIDPAEQAALLAVTPKPKAGADPADTVPGATAAIGQHAWFWTKVPTTLDAVPASRLSLAFDQLKDGPAVTAPRLQKVQEIAAENGVDILKATIGSSVSPALVLAVISVESGGSPKAESEKGAKGLMQLMPDTAARFGVTDSLSREQNINGGVAYLDWLLKEFKGDAVLALAGYNAGEGAVKRHGGVPPYPETRDYVPKVLAAYQVASGLCKTRPQLITDACALQLAIK